MIDPRLAPLARKMLWLSTWTIHNANHGRPSDDAGLKVGGHQASSASSATILTALYGAALCPEDRVAVKPHASPAFHAAFHARPLAFHLRRAPAFHWHALRSIHRARPRCPESRVLSGRALHPRRDALGCDPRPRGRGASIDQDAADRHGSGRAVELRAGLRR